MSMTNTAVSPTLPQFERLVQKIAPQSKLLQTWHLKGGISAEMTALEIEQADGQTRKLIVRRRGDGDPEHNLHPSF